MKTSLQAFAIALFVASMCGLPANATPVEGQFSGYVLSGQDTNNLFGMGQGTELTGLSIMGTFSFDPAEFQAYNVDATGTSAGGYAGPVFGGAALADPFQITETINGHSVVFLGTGGDSAFVMQNCAPVTCAQDYTGFGISVSDTSNMVGSIVDFVSIGSTSKIISDIGDLSSLDFSSIDGTSLSGGFPWAGQIFDNGNNIFFNVVEESAGAAVTNPVPEPGTWAILLSGVGAFAGLRMARRNAAKALGQPTPAHSDGSWGKR